MVLTTVSTVFPHLLPFLDLVCAFWTDCLLPSLPNRFWRAVLMSYYSKKRKWKVVRKS